MKTLVFQPAVHERLRRGIHQIVDPIRPTLGPLPRMVAFSSSFTGEAPELLDKGSLIARRIVQLSDRDADMGANLVRGLLWRLHKQHGDATATAAVLFAALYEGGVKLLTAGYESMALRRALALGEQTILAELERQTTPLADGTQLARAAQSLCQSDPTLGTLLGEIFTVLDAYGAVDVRTSYERESHWEYIDGAYWAGGALAVELLASGRTELENPAILLTDLALDDVRETAAAIETALRAGKRALLIFANYIQPDVTAFLVANRNAGRFPVIAVKTPGAVGARAEALTDLAALVGGRALLSATGISLYNVKAGDFGAARSAWADRDYVGLNGAGGDPSARKAHIDRLKAAHERADDPDHKTALLGRIGKLMGGSAVLWVGGVTQRETKDRKALAESAVAALRGAVQGGVLPGAGVSLLACRPALERQAAACDDPDLRAGLRLLAAALEQPARAILENAGCDPSAILGALARQPVGTGYDVLSERFVPLLDAGIIDSTAAYTAAVRGSIRAAAAALTIDVLVHPRKPEMVLEPG